MPTVFFTPYPWQPHDNHQNHVLSRADLDCREHHLERKKFIRKLRRRQSGLFRLQTVPSFDSRALDLAEEGVESGPETKEYEVKRKPTLYRSFTDSRLEPLDTSPLTSSLKEPKETTL